MQENILKEYRNEETKKNICASEEMNDKRTNWKERSKCVNNSDTTNAKNIEAFKTHRNTICNNQILDINNESAYHPYFIKDENKKNSFNVQNTQLVISNFDEYKNNNLSHSESNNFQNNIKHHFNNLCFFSNKEKELRNEENKKIFNTICFTNYKDCLPLMHNSLKTDKNQSKSDVLDFKRPNTSINKNPSIKKLNLEIDQSIYYQSNENRKNNNSSSPIIDNLSIKKQIFSNKSENNSDYQKKYMKSYSDQKSTQRKITTPMAMMPWNDYFSFYKISTYIVQKI